MGSAVNRDGIRCRSGRSVRGLFRAFIEFHKPCCLAFLQDGLVCVWVFRSYRPPGISDRCRVDLLRGSCLLRNVTCAADHVRRFPVSSRFIHASMRDLPVPVPGIVKRLYPVQGAFYPLAH